MTGQRTKKAPVVSLVGLLAFASWAWGHSHGQMEHGKTETQPSSAPPIRTTMEELHRLGGVPRGWKLLLPPGDSEEGKRAYVAMKCFTCHETKGEHFPQEAKKPGDVGPELTGIGRHHPAEYFAEAILNPNRVIIEGPGFTGPDGLSKMPDYTDTMTLKQLIDLVAYLKSLQ